MLWTAGSSPVSKEGVSDSTPKLPFPHTDKGAVKTDPTLRVRDHPRVFALGDVSGSESPDPSTSGNSLPATAQVCRMLAVSGCMMHLGYSASQSDLRHYDAMHSREGSLTHFVHPAIYSRLTQVFCHSLHVDERVEAVYKAAYNLLPRCSLVILLLCCR